MFSLWTDVEINNNNIELHMGWNKDQHTPSK